MMPGRRGRDPMFWLVLIKNTCIIVSITGIVCCVISIYKLYFEQEGWKAYITPNIVLLIASFYLQEFAMGIHSIGHFLRNVQHREPRDMIISPKELVFSVAEIIVWVYIQCKLISATDVSQYLAIAWKSYVGYIYVLLVGLGLSIPIILIERKKPEQN